MLKPFNVFGVGNALVDTVVSIDEKFLKENRINKGVMTLVGEQEQNRLLASLADYKQTLRSGGSAANTMIALANSGGTGCYTGKVSKDELGNFYKKDMEDAGIIFEVLPSNSGDTGTCVVLTTSDADRTMITHLGISTALDKNDIDLEKLKRSEISYIEGYLWDGKNTKEASIYTMENSKTNGVKVAYTYSDPFCVNRSREEFLNLTKEYFDYIFCNHEEAIVLSGEKEPEKAAAFINTLCPTVFMTWGKNGAIIAHNGVSKLIPGFPVKAIDTVGAGDCFAAGVLYGLTHGYSLEKSTRWGNYVASRIVIEYGARHSEKLNGKQEEILKGY